MSTRTGQSPRENLIRAYRFQSPERIPISVSVGGTCWAYYGRDAVEWVMGRHPTLFPDFRAGEQSEPTFAPWRHKGTFTDSWGCVWHVPEDGITGAVKDPPLASWDEFPNLTVPDPSVENGWAPIDWQPLVARAERRRRARSTGEADDDEPFRLSLRHGHTFLTLEYLRGYENLIFDMHDDEPRLRRLIEIVTNFNLELQAKLLALEPDVFGLPEDLGLQNGPLLSPEMFAEYVAPSYRKYIAPIKRSGAIVHMHSDGHILALADQFIDLGIEVLNIQDLVNGVDSIKEAFGGRVAIDLDIDRQNVTVHGSAIDAGDLVRSEVSTLNTPEGGLSLSYNWGPPTPLENADAVMTAMEECGGHR